MTRAYKKPKARHQQPKKKRRPAPASAGGASGAMTGIRGVFKKAAASNNGKQKKSIAARVVDIGLWIVLAAAAIYWFARQGS